MVLEKTPESLLSDCKEIQPVHPNGNQSWIFTGRTDDEIEALILWPPDAKNWLIWKDPDAGKDWKQEKGMTEGEMVGWCHWLSGHEFEQAPGDGEGQGSLAAVYGVTESRIQLSDRTTKMKSSDKQASSLSIYLFLYQLCWQWCWEKGVFIIFKHM